MILDISHNKLKTLPDCVCDLVKLTTFKATNNKLEKLPGRLTLYLKALKVLNLNGNPLQDPPIEICKQGVAVIRQYQFKSIPQDEIAEIWPTRRSSETPSESLGSEIGDASTEDGGDNIVFTDDKLRERKLRRGDIVTITVKPENKTQIFGLSSDMKIEIPPNALSEEITITAEAAVKPSTPVSLNDFEIPITHHLELGPDGYEFQKPIILGIQGNAEISNEKTREVVVRTRSGGEWKDLNTWMEEETIKVEVDHLSPYQAIWKPKPQKFSVTLSDIETLGISCTNDDISVYAKASSGKSNTLTVTTQLQRVEPKTLLRAREQVERSSNGYFALGNILQIALDVKICNPLTLKLPLPVLPDNVTQPPSKDRIIILTDQNDDLWKNITRDVSFMVIKENCVTFSHERLGGPCCRYVVVYAETSMPLERIVKKATRLTRKGSTLAKFIVLQVGESPEVLYVDCVPSTEADSVIKTRKDEGYLSKMGRGCSKDVDLIEDQVIPLKISGDGIKTSTDERIVFNSRLEIYETIVVNRDPQSAASQNTMTDLIGTMTFLEDVQENEEPARVLVSIPFKLPKVDGMARMIPNTPDIPGILSPVYEPGPFTPIDNKTNIDFAIDTLVEYLSCDNWEPLARVLGLSDTVIGDIRTQYDRVRERIYQMLVKYKQVMGKQAKVKTLVAALESSSVGRKDLADKIQSLIAIEDEDTAFCEEEPRPKTKQQKKPQKPLPYQNKKYEKRPKIAKNREAMNVKTTSVTPTNFSP
ncbi:p53-induced death domain-containing protein 1-like [Glandiceps talaboti]